MNEEEKKKLYCEAAVTKLQRTEGRNRQGHRQKYLAHEAYNVALYVRT